MAFSSTKQHQEVSQEVMHLDEKSPLCDGPAEGALLRLRGGPKEEGRREQELLLPSQQAGRLVGVGHEEAWKKLVNAYCRAAGEEETSPEESNLHPKQDIIEHTPNAADYEDQVSYKTLTDATATTKISTTTTRTTGTSSIAVDTVHNQKKNTQPEESKNEKKTNGGGTSSAAATAGGPQMVVVKGESGTGKTFLAQRLRRSIVDTFQSRYDAHAQAMEQEAKAIDEANKQHQSGGTTNISPHYYHDDTTISTKSGGFLMPDLVKKDTTNYKTAEDGDDDEAESTADYDPDLDLFADLPTGLFARGTFAASITTSGDSKTSSGFPLTAIMESFNDVLDQLLNNELVELESIQQAVLAALNMGMSTPSSSTGGQAGSTRDDEVENAPLLAKLVTLFPSLIYLFDSEQDLGPHMMMTLPEEDEDEDDEDEEHDEEKDKEKPAPRSSFNHNLKQDHDMMDNIGMAKFANADADTETTATGRASRRRSSLLSLQQEQQHQQFIMDEPDAPIKGIVFLIRCFLKAMSDVVQKHYGGPIVLFLDNAQYMDPTSSDFLYSLLPPPLTATVESLEDESELQNLLIVLAVQTKNEQEETQAPAIIGNAAFYNNGHHQSTQEIQMKNLTRNQVRSLITQAMTLEKKMPQLRAARSRSSTPAVDESSTDDEAGTDASDMDADTSDAICDLPNKPTAPAPLPIELLVDFVYQKTGGNGFSVVELLKSLADKDLITFCDDTFQWTYQMESILQQEEQQEYSASDKKSKSKSKRKTKDSGENGDESMVFFDLIKDKIVNRLSKEARFILVMAACLQQHSSTNRDIEKELLAHVVLQYYPTDSENKWSSWISNHFHLLGQAMDWCPETLTVEMDVLLHVETLVASGLLERVVLPGPNQASTTNSTAHLRASGTAGGPGGSSVLRFTHECVRQAALACIPQDFTGQILHMRVGEMLKDMVLALEGVAVAAQETSWMLFTCLDQLCLGPSDLLGEHEAELVHLNHLAAEQAAELYAYLPASTYYGVAIDWLLEKLSQTGNASSLSLGGQLDSLLLIQLRTQLSVCQYRLGSLLASERLAKNVLLSTMGFGSNSSMSLEYKLPVYYNLIQIHKAQGNLEEAVNCGMELLNEVGEKFSKKPSRLRIVMENHKIHKRLHKGKKSVEHLANLSRCVSPVKGAVINAYAALCDPMSVLGYSAAVSLLQLRSVYLTLKYGYTDASALAFAAYSAHLSSQGHIDGGHQFGKCSLVLLRKATSPDLTSRTVIANSLSLHWKDPHKETLDWQLKGYKLGCMNGSIESASVNASLYHSHYYSVGLPLKVGQKDLQISIRQLESNQNKEIIQCKVLLQAVLNLMGRGNAEPTAIIPDPTDQSVPTLVVAKSYQMQLAYYFGNLELAQSLMDELRSYSTLPLAPFFHVACRFFFALIRIAQARKLASSKSAALLKKTKKEDVQWLEVKVRQGANNCLHKLLILKAELATFDAGQDEIQQSFDKAVLAAGQSGFLQDEALANELSAAHFLSSGDFAKGAGYLRRAYEVYGAWGARGKVEQMEAKYVLIKPPNSTSAGSASSDRKVARQQRSLKLPNVHKAVDPRTTHVALTA